MSEDTTLYRLTADVEASLRKGNPWKAPTEKFLQYSGGPVGL